MELSDSHIPPDASSTLPTICSKCGAEVSTLVLVGGRAFCLVCYAKEFPTSKGQSGYAVSNWCPIHGSYAGYIQQCPSCRENPPGVKTITTTSTGGL